MLDFQLYSKVELETWRVEFDNIRFLFSDLFLTVIFYTFFIRIRKLLYNLRLN